MLQLTFTVPLKDEKSLLKALFTDLDGVIRLWDGQHTARSEKEAGLPAGSFWKVAFAPDLLQRAVTGKMTNEQWRAEGKRRLKRLYPQADIDFMMEAWAAAPATVDDEVLHLIRNCRRHVRVGLITNATSTLSSELEQMQLRDEFDFIFNTSELGVAKPDPRVFHIALERVGVEPEESFFVDDRPDNVAAAVNLGMHGHVFQGIESLRDALQTLGLSV